MRRLAVEVERTLEELRSLTHGIPPAALGQRGLVAALRAAAARNLLTTTVFAVGVGRHPPEIESAAYFCCLEAMQNATKHAHGATGIVIDLSEAGGLRLEVRDDGVGFDRAASSPARAAQPARAARRRRRRAHDRVQPGAERGSSAGIPLAGDVPAPVGPRRARG